MNQLKDIRVSKGLSQTDLAKLINTSQQQIHRWEKSIHLPADVAEKIASVLKLPSKSELAQVTKIRFAKCLSETNHLRVLKHRMWGSKRDILNDFEIGETLVLKVGNEIASVYKVSGKPFPSQEPIYDGDLYPFRVPVEPIWVAKKSDRVPFLGLIRDTLLNLWGGKYGLSILNHKPLMGAPADTILEMIGKYPNAVDDIDRDIETHLLEAANEEPKQKKIRIAKIKDLEDVSLEEADKNTSAHFEIQRKLIQLGRMSGCSVWVPIGDKKRVCHGTDLIDNCLMEIPEFGSIEDLKATIRMIDVIWFKGSIPVCAFEVERSSPIHSGLLRMADLLALSSTHQDYIGRPTLSTKLYTVAAKSKISSFFRELSRPTFKKIGLNDFCSFVAIEDVDALLTKAKDFAGHLQPSVIDSIAVNECPDDDPIED